MAPKMAERTVDPAAALAKLDAPAATPRNAAFVRVLCSVARGDDPTSVIEIEPGEVNQLLDLSARHRIVPLALRAIEREHLRAPIGFHRDLVARSLAIEGLIGALDQLALQVAGALARAGHEHRFLKGFATARLDYGSPALRHYGDLDLLIRQGDHPDVVRALNELGLHQLADGRRIWKIHKGWTLLDDRDREVDLHFRLTRALPAVDLAPLWKESELLDGGLLALNGPGRLVHACLHLALSEPGVGRLSSLFDVTVLRRFEHTGRALAHQLGWGNVVEWGLALEAALRTGTEQSYVQRNGREALVHRAYMRGDRRILLDTLCVTLAAPGALGPALIALDKVRARTARRRSASA